MKCGAKTRAGTPCKGQAMRNGKCRMHGGKSPQGIASARTIHGKYSAHLPTRLLSIYEASRRDPDLLNLTESVALIDARLVELLKRIDTGESGATWRAVRDAFNGFEDATGKKDVPAAQSFLSDLKGLITRGRADESAWLDIRSTLEQRRRLVESERKRLVEMQQMVSAEQAALMVKALVASVRQHVHDPQTLRLIADDLGRVALAGTD